MDLVVVEQVVFSNLVRRFLVVILQTVQSKRNLVTMIIYSVSLLPILLNRHTSIPPPCYLLFLGLLFCVSPANSVE